MELEKVRQRHGENLQVISERTLCSKYFTRYLKDIFI